MRLSQQNSWEIEFEKSEHFWGLDWPLRMLRYLRPPGFSTGDTRAFISELFSTTTHAWQRLSRPITACLGEPFIHQYCRIGEVHTMLPIAFFVLSTAILTLLPGWKNFYRMKYEDAAFSLNQAEALDFAAIVSKSCV